MARDFTLQTYHRLLSAYLEHGYRPIPLEHYFREGLPQKRTLLLRHDVDRRPDRSLKMAIMEHEAGVRGTYYFRSLPLSFKPLIIQRIVELGHEIGYHYEDLSREKGKINAALNAFRRNLERLRTFYPVRTACMHGSPLSSHDNKLLFEHIDPEEEGLLGDPYLHIPSGTFLYLTDTGDRWDGNRSSIRDHSQGGTYGIRSSFDLLDALKQGRISDPIHQTFHPQRWTDRTWPWLWERSSQRVKNGIKSILKKPR